MLLSEYNLMWLLFGQLLGKIWLLFILSSGHTVYLEQFVLRRSFILRFLSWRKRFVFIIMMMMMAIRCISLYTISKVVQRSNSWCYKTFYGGNLDFPKIKNWKKFLLMSEPEQKCENNASFEQINTLKLLFAFKMAYSCCFCFRGNLDFPVFLQKKVW